MPARRFLALMGQLLRTAGQPSAIHFSITFLDHLTSDPSLTGAGISPASRIRWTWRSLQPSAVAIQATSTIADSGAVACRLSVSNCVATSFPSFVTPTPNPLRPSQGVRSISPEHFASLAPDRGVLGPRHIFLGTLFPGRLGASLVNPMTRGSFSCR